jgi:hypothetical protein
MAHTRSSDGLFPSLPDRFFEGDSMNWRYASENYTLSAINSKEHDIRYSIEGAAPLSNPLSAFP